MNFLSRLWQPARVVSADADTPADVLAFIESRTLAHVSQQEDDFVKQALALGVESGMVLDVGTRVGLVLLKLLWQNENFVGIGIDSSSLMIDRARETAAAWELKERAVFQVGDAREIRFKENYFDLVISDLSLHRFDDLSSVLQQVHKVLKPKGALLIRDLSRPNRLRMANRIASYRSQYDGAMEPQLITSIRAAYTKSELEQAIRQSGLSGTRLIEANDQLMIERHGETDPGSWVTAREQYR
jgi:ubiquinone/menaquinone biosynthesis C-methylase UbiE